jgi:Arc/MetJ-type ribon-helix-helix transcriptional regulator
MSRVKVSLSLDPLLVRDVDAYVEAHADSDRSKVVDNALQLWSAAQQRSAMELQFADEGDADPAELDAWHQVRREAARRRLRRV